MNQRIDIFTLLILLLLPASQVFGQTNVSVFVEPYAIPSLPGLHSFAAAQYQGKWILIGGRIDGLHQRQPTTSFLCVNSKKLIYEPSTSLLIAF